VHVARDLLRQREFHKAMPHLAEAMRMDPQHSWAWYFLGNCYYELRQLPEAISCYSACLALNRDPSVAYYAYYQRAMTHLKRGRNSDAATTADLDEAIKALAALPPDVASEEQPKPSIARAELLTRKKDYAAAEKTLTEALEFGALHTRILHERARVRHLKKDAAGERRDRDEILRREPESEYDWNIRGLARLPSDPRAALTDFDDPPAALADFDKALAINPRYYPALQNKAHVLSEYLKKPQEALAVLDRVLELYPGYTKGRIGRAVLLARQGKRAEANVYALTSRQEPRDRDRVIPLLAVALWGGFGIDEVRRDPDFELVRDLLKLASLVEIVRDLQRDDRKDR
jgi:eukaryotic-like serine/threonine-protein kinase